jgi:DNA-binding transcriptional regulator YdaS (Cro superfamily)
VSEFAARIGISRIHLGRLMRAQGNFSTDIFEAIERETAGELTAIELFAHYSEQRAASRADQHEGAAS